MYVALDRGIQGSHGATLLLLLLLLQVLTFVSSLFGDLIESIMKRDAGIKVRWPVEHALKGHKSTVLSWS
jgi:CDP-diglyceride synthetase